MSEVTTLRHGQPLRCRAHREWVKSLGCCVPGCRRTEIDPNHITTRGAGGGDDTCVNMCRWHHTEWHQIGRLTWQRKYRILLVPHAAKLAQRSRELGILPALPQPH